MASNGGLTEMFETLTTLMPSASGHIEWQTLKDKFNGLIENAKTKVL